MTMIWYESDAIFDFLQNITVLPVHMYEWPIFLINYLWRCLPASELHDMTMVWEWPIFIINYLWRCPPASWYDNGLKHWASCSPGCAGAMYGKHPRRGPIKIRTFLEADKTGERLCCQLVVTWQPVLWKSVRTRVVACAAHKYTYLSTSDRITSNFF